MSSYTTAFTVDQTPDEVFAAINNVRGWWSGEIDGDTARLGEEFTYRYQDLHLSRQRITESVPGSRVAWEVVDGYVSFVQDKTEWIGTTMTFDISTTDGKTEVRFSHVGLVPDFECFGSCSSAWAFYINSSLHDLITTGKGEPNAATGADLASSHDLLGGSTH
jgi:hypothetical protein